jgi:TonB family protein
MWRRSSVATGVFASLVLHGASLVGLRSASGERKPAPPLSGTNIEFEFASPAPEAAASSARARWLQSPLEFGGPEANSALDLDARPGRGGAEASEGRTLRLFSFVSPLTLQDTDLNNLRQNQVQRIATSPLRATQEERRATPHAADAVFLASGNGGHQERRAPARQDAEQGAQSDVLRPRSEQRADPLPRLGSEPPERPRELAQRESSRTPRGIAHGRGRRPQLAAKVQFARPNVDQGPAATPAEAHDAKVRDNHDAELLAAALQRSIVDASAQRAQRRGDGIGGESGGPGLSQAGEGRGARAQPYMPGPGNASALDTSDKRYVRWFLEQKERVQNELVFPLPRALAKDQGVSIYRIVVRRDGKLADAPRLVRSSGFSDFDQAAVAAIRRALPFSPLPEQLISDSDALPLLIPVAFSNPMVQ